MDIPEIAKVGCALAVIGYYVFTLPKHITTKMRRAYSLALYCCSALFVAMLVNNYVFSFFEYNHYMLLTVFLPTVVYVAYFTYSNKDT